MCLTCIIFWPLHTHHATTDAPQKARFIIIALNDYTGSVLFGGHSPRIFLFMEFQLGFLSVIKSSFHFLLLPLIIFPLELLPSWLERLHTKLEDNNNTFRQMYPRNHDLGNALIIFFSDHWIHQCIMLICLGLLLYRCKLSCFNIINKSLWSCHLAEKKLAYLGYSCISCNFIRHYQQASQCKHRCSAKSKIPRSALNDGWLDYNCEVYTWSWVHSRKEKYALIKKDGSIYYQITIAQLVFAEHYSSSCFCEVHSYQKDRILYSI